MKAVALTIEALALLNNEERKKERKKEVQNGTLANFSLQVSVWFWTPERVQLVMIMKARYFLKL